MFKPLAGEPSPFGPGRSGMPRTAELPLTEFGSEAELAERVLERLDPWFVIEQEARGRHCSGKPLRIDAIMWPRERERWKNSAVAFGVEFKLPYPPGKDIRNYTKWLAQAIDYTHVDWDHHGRLVILTCPGAASWLDEGPKQPEGNQGIGIAKRISGQLNVGELVLRWHYGLTILINGEHVWSERAGVVRGREWALNPKVGHR